MGRRPCCEKVGLKKGPWSADEDEKLISFILSNGHCCWRAVPKLAGLSRCGKSCRLRWTNYLRPDIKRGLLSDEEEQLIIDLHAKLGNKWSKIASQLPGRTDNEIKNCWNTHIKKKLKRMGIDPQTHQPIPTFDASNNENPKSASTDAQSTIPAETENQNSFSRAEEPKNSQNIISADSLSASTSFATAEMTDCKQQHIQIPSHDNLERSFSESPGMAYESLDLMSDVSIFEEFKYFDKQLDGNVVGESLLESSSCTSPQKQPFQWEGSITDMDMMHLWTDSLGFSSFFPPMDLEMTLQPIQNQNQNQNQGLPVNPLFQSL